MKNVIIFHMESLSTLTYKMNEEFFPCLNEISMHSERFINYYSSATSTYMTIIDLFLTGDKNFEKCDYLENIFDDNIKSKLSLFDYLANRGYYGKCIYLNFSPFDQLQLSKLSKIIGNNCDFCYGENENDFRKELQESFKIAKDSPISLFIEDNYSHISFNAVGELNENYTIYNWFKDRYTHVDHTLRIVWDLLEEKDLKENTILLIYGDHGEEYWAHGLYEGYTHAIEPFTSMVRCPLILYNGKSENGHDNKALISTVDIMSLIINRLEEKDDYLSRDFAFSRNLFVAQNKRSNVFHKSYGITDGIFTLILSKEGYSLYMNRLDVGSNCNLLEFFQMKNNKLKYQKKYNYMYSTHFKSFMTEMAIKDIESEFFLLKKELDKYVFDELGLSYEFKKKKIHYIRKNNITVLGFRMFKKKIKEMFNR